MVLEFEVASFCLAPIISDVDEDFYSR